MTLQECYTQLGGNYEDAVNRLMNEKLVQRFLFKFIEDPTMNKLLQAVDEKNIEDSFVAAHTLKGVAANLALSSLQKSASDLTEQLRDRSHEADSELLKVVVDTYEQNISTIKKYKESVF